MALRPANPALTARRNQLLAQLRRTTAARTAAAWSNLSDHSAASQPKFAAAARPALVAGQTKAIDLTAAYLQALTKVTPRIDRQAILDSLPDDLDSPFYTVGAHLDAGEGILAALAAGLAVATALGFDGVQRASRSAGSAFDHSDRVIGWERIPDGGACDWCVMVADQTYNTADSASFGHNSCGCDTAPLLAG